MKTRVELFKISESLNYISGLVPFLAARNLSFLDPEIKAFESEEEKLKKSYSDGEEYMYTEAPYGQIAVKYNDKFIIRSIFELMSDEEQKAILAQNNQKKFWHLVSPENITAFRSDLKKLLDSEISTDPRKILFSENELVDMCNKVTGGSTKLDASTLAAHISILISEGYVSFEEPKEEPAPVEAVKEVVKAEGPKIKNRKL